MADTRRIKAILEAEDRASPIFGKVSNALNVLGGIAAAVGAYAIARKLVDGMRAAVEAAAAQEKAEATLAQALRLRGQAVDSLLPSLRDYATGLMNTTGVADELILQNQALLVSIGKLSGEGLQRATKAALDMGAATGNLQTAFQLVAKAAAGNTQTLARYGIILDEGIPKAQKYEAALAKIEALFGGQAAAQLDTYAGRVQNVKTQWGEFLEKLGLTIIQSPAVNMALEELGNAIRDLTEDLSTEKGQQAIKTLTVAMIDFAIVAARISPVLVNTGTLFGGFIGVLTDGVPNNVVDGMKRVFDTMQATHNNMAGLVDRLEVIRERVSAASTEPLTIETRESMKGVVDLGDALAEIPKKIKEVKTPLEQLGISGLAELQKQASLVSRAIQQLTDDFARGGTMTAEQYGAILEQLVDVGTKLEEQGVAVQGMPEYVKAIAVEWLTVSDAVNILANEGMAGLSSQADGVLTKIERLSTTIRRGIRQVGVSSALAFGDALVDAATGAEVKFGEFFRQLLRDLAKAILQAIILQTILGIFSGGTSAAVRAAGAYAGDISGGFQRFGSRKPVGSVGSGSELANLAFESQSVPVVNLTLTGSLSSLVDQVTSSVESGRLRLVASEVATTRLVR